jgi:hypothetical protein
VKVSSWRGAITSVICDSGGALSYCPLHPDEGAGKPSPTYLNRGKVVSRKGDVAEMANAAIEPALQITEGNVAEELPKPSERFPIDRRTLLKTPVAITEAILAPDVTFSEHRPVVSALSGSTASEPPLLNPCASTSAVFWKSSVETNYAGKLNYRFCRLRKNYGE